MSSCERILIRLCGPVRRVLLSALLMIAAIQPAGAVSDSDAPWHALAYGYLNTLFLLNLEPIDWPMIERVLTTDHDGRILGRPASEHLIELDQETGAMHWEAVETALAARHADTLYAATTRALSAAIRQHLANAAKVLEQPGLAGAEIGQAQALFRAIAGGIKQTDPAGFRALRLAWLELVSSIRLSDVINASGLPADEAAFASARVLLTDYLLSNFEPEVFAPRRTYAPIPEQRLVADPDIALPPWLPPGSEVTGPEPPPRLILNVEQQGRGERRPFLVAYGEMLFNSPEINGDPARRLGITCSSCHDRGDVNRRFFITGISPQAGSVDVDSGFFNAKANDHRADALDIPSLRGLRFTGPYGRDGRFASLRDFTRDIIVNRLGGGEPSPLVLDALVAYMLEFDFLPAPHLERDGSLTAAASDMTKRGELLFRQPYPSMSGKSCASCHQPDSHFTDNQVHDIGSAGQGASSGFSGAYDTPSLLGAVQTAPYFHDGRFGSLAEVVAWKNEAAGLGLDESEQAELTAYLEAAGEGQDAYQDVDDDATPLRRIIEPHLVSLGTLDALIPERDRNHADLLLRSVAGQVELEAGSLPSREDRETVLELTEDLWQLRDLILHDSWDEAAIAWQDCRKTMDAFGMELH